MDLDVQVSKLKLLKANHTSQIYRLESDIAKNFPVQISALKERIAGMQIDSQVVKSVDLQDNDMFAMTVGNVLYEDKKEAGEALIAACAGLKTVSTGGKVGGISWVYVICFLQYVLQCIWTDGQREMFL